ncbi:MAG: thioredoxin domain-containing protein [Candidatus Pacebacteria bacterium]|nr:thioredoxin domain-containing protein [Candidatus Paceibacterota bacterium]
MDNTDSNKKGISPGAAIVVAGVLIAGAIIFTNSSKSPSVKTNEVVEKNTISLSELAEKAGVNKKDFDSCMKERKGLAKVNADADGGEKAGVQGTPASFIVAKNGTILSINGAASYADVKEKLDQVLASTSRLAESEDIEVPALAADDRYLGNINADVVIIEYSDIDCPFCKRFHPTMERIAQEYGSKIAWVYRHFPLDSLHPEARTKAEATECVAQLAGNEVFWKYLKTLVVN